jgi:hypothetical protein
MYQHEPAMERSGYHAGAGGGWRAPRAAKSAITLDNAPFCWPEEALRKR